MCQFLSSSLSLNGHKFLRSKHGMFFISFGFQTSLRLPLGQNLREPGGECSARMIFWNGWSSETRVSHLQSLNYIAVSVHQMNTYLSFVFGDPILENRSIFPMTLFICHSAPESSGATFKSQLLVLLYVQIFMRFYEYIIYDYAYVQHIQFQWSRLFLS